MHLKPKCSLQRVRQVCLSLRLTCAPESHDLCAVKVQIQQCYPQCVRGPVCHPAGMPRALSKFRSLCKHWTQSDRLCPHTGNILYDRLPTHLPAHDAAVQCTIPTATCGRRPMLVRAPCSGRWQEQCSSSKQG
eukprot:scaffold282189_cov22-Tisochrysis_lutea.AAC.1